MFQFVWVTVEKQLFFVSLEWFQTKFKHTFKFSYKTFDANWSEKWETKIELRDENEKHIILQFKFLHEFLMHFKAGKLLEIFNSVC